MFGPQLRESGSKLLLKTVFSPYVPLVSLSYEPKNNREVLTSVMVQNVLQGKEVSRTFPVFDKLEGITTRLLENNPELTKPKFHITDSSDIPAFSLSEHIVISEDALRLSSDSQIAFIIGHEMSHNLLDHHMESVSWKVLELLIFGTILTVISRGKVLTSVVWIMVNPFKLMFTYPVMRAGELDADDLGLKMMAEAGYNPEEVLDMWDDFESSRPTPFWLVYITDHPSHQQRKARQKQWIVEVSNNS